MCGDERRERRYVDSERRHPAGHADDETRAASHERVEERVPREDVEDTIGRGGLHARGVLVEPVGESGVAAGRVRVSVRPLDAHRLEQHLGRLGRTPGRLLEARGARGDVQIGLGGRFGIGRGRGRVGGRGGGGEAAPTRERSEERAEAARGGRADEAPRRRRASGSDGERERRAHARCHRRRHRQRRGGRVGVARGGEHAGGEPRDDRYRHRR